MTKKNIEIVLLKDNEIEELNNFYNSIHKVNRDKEKFVWEFVNAPAGKAIYVIAKDIDTQKIVGTQCAIPIEIINDKGNVVLTAKSEDTIVHPDYRGLNIFDNMYKLLFEKCRENGIKYLWGFTSAKKPFLKLGFEIPFIHTQSLMVFSIISAYKYLSKLNSKNSFLPLLKIFFLCFASKLISLKRLLISEKSLDKNFSFSHYDKSTVKDNNQLFPKSTYNGFWIKQNLSFLTWRIANNPYHEKIFNIYFCLNSNVVANLIFNHHKNSVWYLINDTYSAEISEEQRIAILNKSIKLLLAKEKNNVKLIRTWDFSHNDYGKNEIITRKKIGFIHLERGVSFVWKSLDESNTLNANDFILSRIATQGVV